MARARLVTIDSIEGNSNLGNAVFSNYGKMQNYQYLVLTPIKAETTQEDKGNNGTIKEESMQFRVKRPVTDQVTTAKKPGTADPQLMSVNQRR